jgi:hypothetical protein
MMPRNIDTLPDTRATAAAALATARACAAATVAHQSAANWAARAEETGELCHIKAARDAYTLAAMADEDAASASQLSANHASHAASAFSMKGLTIV